MRILSLFALLLLPTSTRPIQSPTSQRIPISFSLPQSWEKFGIEYEEPNDIVIVDERSINDSLNTFSILSPVRRKNVFDKLHSLHFLPLKLNDERLPSLLRLYGFFLSEARLHLAKDGLRIDTYAREGIVTLARNDLTSLGIPANVTAQITPFKKTSNFYSLTDTSTTYRLQIASTPPAILFHALGLPIGKRGEQKLAIPTWILDKATKWQQGLFLSSYLGCRMATPTAKTKYHFNGIFVQQSQRTPFLEYGIAFQEQLRSLLNRFDIESGEVTHFEDYTTPNTQRIRFKIKESDANLIRVFSTLTFEYHPEKQLYANLVNHYLRCKKIFVAENPLIHLSDFPTWDEFLAQHKTKDGLIFVTPNLTP